MSVIEQSLKHEVLRAKSERTHKMCSEFDIAVGRAISEQTYKVIDSGGQLVLMEVQGIRIVAKAMSEGDNDKIVFDTEYTVPGTFIRQVDQIGTAVHNVQSHVARIDAQLPSSLLDNTMLAQGEYELRETVSESTALLCACFNKLCDIPVEST